MRNSTQTWGLSTDPDVLLTVPKNSFQTIPERYNQPPVSLILPKVYYAWSRRSNAFDKSRRTTKAIFLRGLDIEKKMVENMINPTRNTDVMPGKWIQLSGVWVKKKAKQARMIYALPFLQKKYFTKCYWKIMITPTRSWSINFKFNLGMHDWNRQQKAISLYTLDNIQQTHGRRQKRWTSQVGVYLFSHLLILEETISMQSYEAF